MTKPAKRRVPSGRVTPKKGSETSKGGKPTPSSRYTPPIPQEVKTSPMWVPVLMFVLLGLGMVVIVLNYVGLLPGATDNKYLWGGLAMICGGIITATQYR